MTGAVPSSTYRLQLGPDLDLRAARELVTGLRRLGVSHLYLSPILQAAPGSTHGYDVVDHAAISDDLGGRRAFDELAAAVVSSGGGLVIDVVPNHMSIAAPAANRWWWDVLEHGPDSRYARYFDITWESHELRQRDTVLLPVLGDHYGRVLEAGELVIEHGERGFVVRYFDHRFPLSPESVAMIVRAPAEGSIAERLAGVNADVDLVHELLEQQHYQLCHWRRARHDLDYRRFFDIDTLIGVRVEDPTVFDDTHALTVELVASGLVDGLRIDHPDGLADPAAYLDRLADATPGAWIVVEKILEAGETLPDDWSVHGTTGYDFAATVNGLLLDPDGVDSLTAWWRDHVDPASWDEVVRVAKREIVRGVLAADVARVADVAVRLCERHRRQRDHTRHDLTEAVRSLLEVFPVYRTYVGGSSPSEADLGVLAEAFASAREVAPEIDADLFDFLHEVLAGRHRDGGIADEFVLRFQQLTGPAMAKSVEDTAFYRHLPVVGANEVGADPGEPVRTVEDFHAHNSAIHQRWPATMTTLSTHDTKRSADVRARLAVLTERAEDWIGFLDEWVARLDGWWEVEPDRATSVLALQTVVGAWPIDADRLAGYLEKATKEAKRRTSWTEPDAAYDAAVQSLAKRMLADAELVGAVEALVDRIVVAGRSKSLAQQLLQLTSPGVPDVYQGQERWDLSLVDPDNRRPVDHASREEALERLIADGGPGHDLSADAGGAHKLWLTHQALTLRGRHPECFGPGDAGSYEPVEAGDNAVAFLRGGRILTVARVRSSARSVEVELPTGVWIDRLTGEPHEGAVTVETVALFEKADA